MQHSRPFCVTNYSYCPLEFKFTKTKGETNRNGKTNETYRERKIDMEPGFGFLNTNLRITLLSARGKEQAKYELGFAFMAINLRNTPP